MTSPGSLCPVADLCLTDLVNISSVLKNIIWPSFGPQCCPTLITSNTGQVVFTKESHSILSSLCLSHPVAKIILESVKVHSGVYGDGCKTLILYLYELFRGIERNLNVLVWQTNRTALKSSISLSLYKYIKEDLTSLCISLTKSVVEDKCSSEGDSSQSIKVKQVIVTLLNGNLPEDVVDHLANLISTFILPLNGNGDRPILNSCFLNCVHVFPNKSYLTSQLVDGLFFTGVAHPYLIKCVKTTKFVITVCRIEEEEHDSQTEYFFQFTSDKIQEKTLSYKMQTVKVFLESLKKLGVSLIVSSQKVPDFVLSTCNSFDINVFSCVEQDDVEFISLYTGMSPITSVHDEIKEINIYEVHSYDQDVYSGKHILKLVCTGKLPNWRAKSIFLHAPSEGLAQQLKLLIRKCFKVICHLFDDLRYKTYPKDSRNVGRSCLNVIENKSVEIFTLNKGSCQTSEEDKCNVLDSSNVICGGGYFEFLLCYLIEKNIDKTSAEKKIWADLVTKMLLSVPQTLFYNLHPNSANQTLSFINASKEAKKFLQGNSTVGFNSKGKLCDGLTSGVVDVLSVKIASLFAALDLAIMLLRTNSILGVKRLPEQETPTAR